MENIFKDLDLSYRCRFNENPTEDTLYEIAFELESIQSYQGVLLTYEEKVIILNNVVSNCVGNISIANESDNSAFINMTNRISQILKGK